MMQSKFITLLFVTLFMYSYNVQAACDSMNLSSTSTSVSLNANNLPALNIRVNKGTGSCSNFFVTIDNGGANSYANRVLLANSHSYPIQFYKDSGRNQILKSEFEASGSDAISGSFSGGSSSFNFTYYAYINTTANQYIRFGYYSNNFTLKLFEGDLSNRILRDSKVVNLSYNQFKTVDISLVSTGAAFNITDTSQTLDFGTLKEGASMGFDIVLLYNAGYSISMSSTNGGKLKHLSARPAKFVPYALSLAGINVPVATVPNVVKSGAGVSPEGGIRLPVNVTIGSISEAIPGTYSDSVTISVTSSE